MAKDKGKRRLYRIGEAAAALKLKTCVLRFWEGEFPQLEPLRTPKGQRLYREEDMRLLRRIRSLLHEKGMTIDGARRVLSGEMGLPSPRPQTPTVSVAVEENVTVVSFPAFCSTAFFLAVCSLSGAGFQTGGSSCRAGGDSGKRKSASS